MKAGILRHRVTIQRFVTTNVGGVLTEEWVDFDTDLPAQIGYVSGREFNAAAATQSEAAIPIKLRYRNDLMANMRVTHKGRTFNIVAVPPVAARDGSMQLMATEGVNAG